jgi:micrococcal nuclease
MTPQYIYRASLVKVVDGDTIIVMLDLGCHTYIKKRIRLLGLNAPELKTDEGQASKTWLTEHLIGELVIETKKDRTDKYARLLGTVYVNDANINELMLAENMAVKYG